jgi:hypothetical protein
MEPTLQKKSSGLPIFGVFLILLGAGFILNKLHVFHYSWGIILWVCLSVVGVVTVVQAFITRRRGVVFWGSLLFFVSVTMIAHRFVLIDFAPWDVPATFSLALGLSFLMLFFYDPRRFGVLIPVLFFGGYGVLYYLWWWDVIDWFEMRHYLFTYWPVFVILWGLSLIFRRR